MRSIDESEKEPKIEESERDISIIYTRTRFKHKRRQNAAMISEMHKTPSRNHANLRSSTHLIVFIILVRNIAEQDIVGGWAAMISYPLRFNPKKYPYPPPQNLQYFHKKNTPLQVIEMV